MGKKVEIENRTRDCLIFPAYREVVQAGGKTRLIPDHEGDIVLGDMVNTPALMQSHGVDYGPRCPAPVVVVDQDAIDNVLKQPVVKSHWDARVRRGEIRLRAA